MNKTFRFPSNLLTRVIVILTVYALFCAPAIQTAQADAAPPPDPTIGGAGPYQPLKTKVQMMSETVLIEVVGHTPQALDERVRVSASFNMQNQGRSVEKMKVIFPLTRLSDYSEEQALYEVDYASFVVRVDNQIVPTTIITTPTEKGYMLEWASHSASPSSGYLPSVRWAAFEVTFPVRKNVLLQVDYNMVASSGNEFTAIEYILETGAGWYDNILSADIILHLRYPASEEIIRSANSGYTFSMNEIRWHKENFEPTGKDNLSVRVFSSKTWYDILKLRSKVKQYPEDANAWYKLGNGYMPLAIRSYSFQTISYSVLNNHFVDLAIEAYQQAITLRPDWGDPHFKIAKILWAQNAKRDDVTLEDPSMQQILSELNIAWSYGITNVGEASALVQNINAHIPGLELKVQPAPATAGMSFSIPTSTSGEQQKPLPTPNATQPLPASNSTKTPLSATNVSLGVILFIAVLALIYLGQSKFGSKK